GGAEHHTRKFSELRSNLVVAIRFLEVAARALAQPSELTPIGERDGDPGRLESRHAGVERRILAYRHSPAEGRDRGIPDRLFGERVIARAPAETQRGRRVS